MPQSIHKVLIYGVRLIKETVLPVGMMSEEAQEARNKDCKYFKEHNTRKTSRVKTMEDLLYILLVSSDPLVSSLRKKTRKRNKSMHPEVLDLLHVEDDTNDVDSN